MKNAPLFKDGARRETMRHLFLSAALTALIPGAAWAAPIARRGRGVRAGDAGALSLLAPGRWRRSSSMRATSPAWRAPPAIWSPI